MIIKLTLTAISSFFSILIAEIFRKEMPFLADAFLIIIGANIYYFLWMKKGTQHNGQ